MENLDFEKESEERVRRKIRLEEEIYETIIKICEGIRNEEDHDEAYAGTIRALAELISASCNGN